MNAREAAYATLIESITQSDVARELGVTIEFIDGEIRKGRIPTLDSGRVAGTELAKYLSSQRQDSSRPLDRRGRIECE
jgi:hypothetical protein